MINIEDKHNCCGCTACIQKCPKKCIKLYTDNEGFTYPIVDKTSCVDCHVCENVCPIILDYPKRMPIKVYAAINKNEDIKRESSSGGIFTYIAEQIISKGGVVFGARFDDNWQVKLDYTETIEGLKAFRGSKYVQASVEDTYKKAESFLKDNRIVLFSGTPCQIGGLKSYLRKEYENLLTLDFLCHGVPSPKVWRKYLVELLTLIGEKNSVSFSSILTPNSERDTLINGISFRNKELGWKKFSFVLQYNLTKAIAEGKQNTVSFSQYHRDNTYMKGFLYDLFLRPSCHSCRFKRFQSRSDMTIADYWAISRIRPDFEDYYGVSMIFLNSLKMNDYFHSSDLHIIETTFEDTLSNKGLHENVMKHHKRDYFFKRLDNVDSIIKLIEKCVKPSLAHRIKNKIKSILR